MSFASGVPSGAAPGATTPRAGAGPSLWDRHPPFGRPRPVRARPWRASQPEPAPPALKAIFFPSRRPILGPRDLRATDLAFGDRAALRTIFGCAPSFLGR